MFYFTYFLYKLLFKQNLLTIKKKNMRNLYKIVSDFVIQSFLFLNKNAGCFIYYYSY